MLDDLVALRHVLAVGRHRFLGKVWGLVDMLLV